MTGPFKEHEDGLTSAILELEAKGFKVQRMNRKIPDAVAYKDGKFYAVEMMGQKWTPNKGWEVLRIGLCWNYYFQIEKKLKQRRGVDEFWA